LYILGDGRKLDWVKREIKLKKLESKVFILGRFPSSRMNDFFLHADALLVSLKKDPIFDITIPGKLQSYLASSKPIIAVLNGEGKRVIKESMSGIVVEPGNVVGLTAAFNTMSQLDTAEIDLMGTNGFNYAEKHFKKETTLELLDSWMKDLA
jgi:glycosyltransferase involved in cell wall biosynthesis